MIPVHVSSPYGTDNISRMELKQIRRPHITTAAKEFAPFIASWKPRSMWLRSEWGPKTIGGPSLPVGSPGCLLPRPRKAPRPAHSTLGQQSARPMLPGPVTVTSRLLLGANFPMHFCTRLSQFHAICRCKTTWEFKRPKALTDSPCVSGNSHPSTRSDLYGFDHVSLS